jgi:hypothetical protein
VRPSPAATGRLLGNAGHAGRDQMRVGADRAEDGVQRLDRGEQQARLTAGEERPQRVVDPPRILPEQDLLSLAPG